MKKCIIMLSLLGDPMLSINGGFNRTVFELAQFNATLNFPFLILTTKTDKSLPDYEVISDNISIYRIYIPPEYLQNQDSLFGNANFFIKQIEKIVKASRMTPILIHSFFWLSGYLAALIKKKDNIPYIHNPIGLAREREAVGVKPKSTAQAKCEEIAFGSANCIISITKSEAEFLQSAYGIHANKIIIVGRSIDRSFLSPPHDSNGNISRSMLKETVLSHKIKANWWVDGAFCYFGRIIDYKGISEIILAWEQVYEIFGEITPPMWIIGGSPDIILEFRHKILSKIPNLLFYEKSHKLYWWGFLDVSGISAILLKAKAVIVHSRFETGGRVIIEAMSAGKPVISTPYGFGKDYIIDWYNGFLVEFGDVGLLSKRLQLFVINNYLTNLLGSNAREYMESVINGWQYFDKIKKIYMSYFNAQHIISPIFEYTKPDSILAYKVNSFPFCDVKLTVAELAQLFGGRRTAKLESNNSYLWSSIGDDGELIVKQYLNSFNYAQLWNCFSSDEVFHLLDLYNTAVHSTSYMHILPLAHDFSLYFCYAMKKANIIIFDVSVLTDKNFQRRIKEFHFSHKFTHCSAVSLDTQEKITKELKTFHERNKNIQRYHKYFTLDLLISELIFILKMAKGISQEELERYLNMLNCLLLKNKQFPQAFGLVYGKSFINHTCIIDEKICLLPSTNIYLGELGFDEGCTLCELMISKKITVKVAKTLFEPKVFLWATSLLLEKIISHRILYKNNYEETSLLKELFDIVYQEF